MHDDSWCSEEQVDIWQSTTNLKLMIEEYGSRLLANGKGSNAKRD